MEQLGLRVRGNLLDLADKVYSLRLKIESAADSKTNVRGGIAQLKSGLEGRLDFETSISEFPTELYTAELNILRQQAIDPAKELGRILEEDKEKIKRLSLERRMELAASRVRQIVDNFGVVLYAGVGCYSLFKHDFSIALPVLTSAAYYIKDTFNDKGSLITKDNLKAFGFSVLPSLEFLSYYLLTGNPDYGRSASAYAFLPSQFLLMGMIAPSFRVKAHYYQTLVERGKGALSMVKVPRDIKNGIKRLNVVLGEMQLLKNLSDFDEEKYEQLVNNFGESCIQYLNGNSGMDSIKESRRQIEIACSSKPQKPANAKPQASTGRHQLQVKPQSRSPYHRETYDFAYTLGFDDEFARRLARSVPIRQVNAFILRAESLGQEIYKPILKANPSLLFLDERRIDRYFSSLFSTYGAITSRFESEVPDSFSINRNPTAFSSIEGLNVLSQMLEEKIVGNDSDENVRWVGPLSNEGYGNFRLLDAMMRHGFELDSIRPRIVMNYKNFPRIKKHTSHDSNVTQRDMDGFDGEFGKLISDGVILTFKQGKGSGGRFPGCYSITSDINDIDKSALKSYIRHLFYEIPKR